MGRRQSGIYKAARLSRTPPAERLLSQHPNRLVGMAWPGPMHAFLVHLTDRASEQAGKTPRSKIAAAAIVRLWMNNPGIEQITDTVNGYRDGKVADIFPDGDSSVTISGLPVKKFGLQLPGPVNKVIKELVQVVPDSLRLSQREITAAALFELRPGSEPSPPQPADLTRHYDEIRLGEVFPGIDEPVL